MSFKNNKVFKLISQVFLLLLTQLSYAVVLPQAEYYPDLNIRLMPQVVDIVNNSHGQLSRQDVFQAFAKLQKMFAGQNQSCFLILDNSIVIEGNPVTGEVFRLILPSPTVT